MNNQPTRREFSQALAGLACVGLTRATAHAEAKPVAPRRLFCLQTYSYSIRQRQERGFDDPLAFMQFTNRQGFAGVQLRLGMRSAEYLGQVRAAKNKLGIALEGIVAPPLEEKD